MVPSSDSMVLPIPSPRTSAPSPLTWAGRGPRRGAGCRGQWPGPRQTGGRRAAERAVLPGCLHTGRAGLRHSPGTGEMGGVSGQCPWPGPSTWLCLTEKTPQPLSATVSSPVTGSAQRTVGAVVTVVYHTCRHDRSHDFLSITENPPPHAQPSPQLGPD